MSGKAEFRPDWDSILSRLEQELDTQESSSKKAILLYESAEILFREKKDVEGAARRLVEALKLDPDLYPAISRLLVMYSGAAGPEHIDRLLMYEMAAARTDSDRARILASQASVQWLYKKPRTEYFPLLEKSLKSHPGHRESLLLMLAGLEEPLSRMKILHLWTRACRDADFKAILLVCFGFCAARSGNFDSARKAVRAVEKLEYSESGRLDLRLSVAAVNLAAGSYSDAVTALEDAASILMDAAFTPKEDRKIFTGWTTEHLKGATASLMLRAAWTLTSAGVDMDRATELLAGAGEMMPESRFISAQKAVLLCSRGRSSEAVAMDGAGRWMGGRLLTDLAVLSPGAFDQDLPGISEKSFLFDMLKQVVLSERGGLIGDGFLDSIRSLSGRVPSPVMASLLTRAGTAMWEKEPEKAGRFMAEAAFQDSSLVPPDLTAAILFSSGALSDASIRSLLDAETESQENRLMMMSLLADYARYQLDNPELALECCREAASEAGDDVWPVFMASMDTACRGSHNATAESWLRIARMLDDDTEALQWKAAAAWILGRDDETVSRAAELLDEVLAEEPGHSLAGEGRSTLLMQTANWTELDQSLEMRAKVTGSRGKKQENHRIRLCRAFIHAVHLNDPQKALDFVDDVLSEADGSIPDCDVLAGLLFCCHMAEQAGNIDKLNLLMNHVFSHSAEFPAISAYTSLRLAEILAFHSSSPAEATAHLDESAKFGDLTVVSFVEKIFLSAVNRSAFTVESENDPQDPENAEARALGALFASGLFLSGGKMKEFAKEACKLDFFDRGGMRLVAFAASDCGADSDSAVARSKRLLECGIPDSVRFAVEAGLAGHTAGGRIINEKDLSGFPDPEEMDPASVMLAADRMESSWPAAFRAALCERRARLEQENNRIVHWLIEAAEAYVDIPDIESAADVYERCMRLDPGYLPAVRGMTGIADGSGRYEQGAEAFMELSEWEADNRDAGDDCFAASELWNKAGRSDERENACRKCFQYNPLHEKGFELLKKIFHDRNDDEAFRDLIIERIKAERNPQTLASLYCELADALLALDDIDGAVQALDYVREIDPDRVDIIVTRAHIMAAAGRWKDLLAVVDDLDEDAPADFRDLWLKAAEVAEQELEDPRKASQYLKTLMKRDEDPDTAGRLLSLAERNRFHVDAADALGRLAEIALKAGEKDKATGHLKREAGIIMNKIGDRDWGRKVLKQILDFQPADMEILENWLELGPAQDEVSLILEKAADELKVAFSSSRMDAEIVRDLLRIRKWRNDSEGMRLTREVLQHLRPGSVSIPPPRPYRPVQPRGRLDAVLISRLWGAGEKDSLRRLLSVTAPYANDIRRSPDDDQGDELVEFKEGDPVASRLAAFAAAVGIRKLYIFQGGDPLTISAIPSRGVALRAGSHVDHDLSPRLNFNAGREIMLASLALYATGEKAIEDTAAMAAAVAAALGAGIKLHDLKGRADQMKSRAAKVLSDKDRESLKPLIKHFSGCTEKYLIQWVKRLVLSADRYGFVLCGDLNESIAAIRAAEMNMDDARFIQQRVDTVCEFALSDDVLNIRAALGLVDN